MELSVLTAERAGLARKVSKKTSELLWEKPFQDRDLVIYTRTISWVSEDE